MLVMTSTAHHREAGYEKLQRTSFDASTLLKLGLRRKLYGHGRNRSAKDLRPVADTLGTPLVSRCCVPCQDTPSLCRNISALPLLTLQSTYAADFGDLTSGATSVMRNARDPSQL